MSQCVLGFTEGVQAMTNSWLMKYFNNKNEDKK